MKRAANERTAFSNTSSSYARPWQQIRNKVKCTSAKICGLNNFIKKTRENLSLICYCQTIESIGSRVVTHHTIKYHVLWLEATSIEYSHNLTCSATKAPPRPSPKNIGIVNSKIMTDAILHCNLHLYGIKYRISASQTHLVRNCSCEISNQACCRSHPWRAARS